ncbi:MAG: rod-binding protein [Halobacteriovoraceae bacterium]|nr:rod-binding protein [Halobacteriovoraceae bacterium]
MSIKASNLGEMVKSPIKRSQTLNQLDNLHLVPDPYKKVAAGMERQFADFMIQQMNKTVGDETQSSGEQFYKSLQDSERARILTEKDGGLGLQRLILEQIYPKNQRTQENYKRYMANEQALQKISQRNKQIQINKDKGQLIKNIDLEPQTKDSKEQIRLKEKVYE